MAVFRKRRIVLAVMLALAAPPIYVGSYLCFNWCGQRFLWDDGAGRGRKGHWWYGVARAPYIPLDRYRGSELPWAYQLDRARRRSIMAGQNAYIRAHATPRPNVRTADEPPVKD